MSRVLLASGDTLYLETDDALERVQPILKRARGRRGRAYCICLDADRVPVTIVRLERAGGEHFTLRTHPGQKMRHHPKCDFTTLVETPSRAGASEEALPPGRLRIEGGIMIRDAVAPSADDEKSEPRGEAGASGTAATRLLDVAKEAMGGMWPRSPRWSAAKANMTNGGAASP